MQQIFYEILITYFPLANPPLSVPSNTLYEKDCPISIPTPHDIDVTNSSHLHSVRASLLFRQPS